MALLTIRWPHSGIKSYDTREIEINIFLDLGKGTYNKWIKKLCNFNSRWGNNGMYEEIHRDPGDARGHEDT